MGSVQNLLKDAKRILHKAKSYSIVQFSYKRGKKEL